MSSLISLNTSSKSSLSTEIIILSADCASSLLLSVIVICGKSSFILFNFFMFLLDIISSSGFIKLSFNKFTD